MEKKNVQNVRKERKEKKGRKERREEGNVLSIKYCSPGLGPENILSMGDHGWVMSLRLLICLME